MDPDIELPPEGDDVQSPEDADLTLENPAKPKIKPPVPYSAYQKKMDDNIRLNKRVKELEAADNTRNSANQTEAQRLQKLLDDATAELTTTKSALVSTKVERQVEKAARQLDFRDPEDALQLVRTKLEVDDDGTVLNADDLLKDLAKTKPYLLSDKTAAPKTPAAAKAPPANGGSPANPSGAKQTIKSRAELAGLTNAQIMEKLASGELNDLLRGASK